MAVASTRKRTTRTRLRNVLFAFPLVAAALLSHTPRARADYATGNTTYSTNISPNEARAINIILALEGGWNPHDNGSVSNYGILASAHGLTDQQDHDLTKSDAVEIYDEDYWHKIRGIDQMPFAMEVVALNAAVNINPTQANIMDAPAHNDYRVVMRETQDWYNGLDAENDELYGPDMPGWEARQRKIANFIREDLPDAEPDNSFAEIDPAAPAPAVKVNHPAPEQVSFLPEANAATMTPSGSPEAIKALPNELPPTGEEMQAAASGMAGDTLWAFLLAPLVAIWRKLFRPRRRPSHNYRPHENPIEVTVVGIRPEIAASDNGPRTTRTYASGGHGSMGHSSTFNQDHLTGFSELERAAFIKNFSHHFVGAATQPQGQWRVHLDDKSHLVIEPQRITIHGAGDKQIEATLIYAADAWGGCKVSGATAEYADNMAKVAHKMISQGRLPANFVMEGVPSFATAPEPVTTPQPVATKSSPYRPSPSRGSTSWASRNKPVLA